MFILIRGFHFISKCSTLYGFPSLNYVQNNLNFILKYEI